MVEKPNKYGARTFSQSSYDNNDLIAKYMFIPFLKARNHIIMMEAENFKHDLITVQNYNIHCFELEISSKPFEGIDSFPFESVSFLGRKKRLHQIKPFHYVIISKSTGWALSAQSSTIYQDQYIKELKINKNGRVGKDLCYWLPKEKCKFFKL